jgi:hypothetical protein
MSRPNLCHSWGFSASPCSQKPPLCPVMSKISSAHLATSKFLYVLFNIILSLREMSPVVSSLRFWPPFSYCMSYTFGALGKFLTRSVVCNRTATIQWNKEGNLQDLAVHWCLVNAQHILPATSTSRTIFSKSPSFTICSAQMSAFDVHSGLRVELYVLLGYWIKLRNPSSQRANYTCNYFMWRVHCHSKQHTIRDFFKILNFIYVLTAQRSCAKECRQDVFWDLFYLCCVVWSMYHVCPGSVCTSRLGSLRPSWNTAVRSANLGI